MSSIANTVLIMCVTLVAAELLSKLAPESDMIVFMKSLIFLVVILSAIMAILDIDFSFDMQEINAQKQGTELVEYINEQYEKAAIDDTKKYIEGLLASVEISVEEINVFTDTAQDGSISIKKIEIYILNESERERILALINGVLNSEVETEVKLLA